MFRLEWAPESARWIDQLPVLMEHAVRDAGSIALSRTLSRGLSAARQRAPGFEGDIARALGVRGPLLDLFGLVTGEITFIRATTMVDQEDWGPETPTPYNYGWGVHTPGSKPHKVYLYNPYSGGSTKSRQKLVRWLKQKAGSPYDQLPDAPTREWFRRNKGVRPWVNVDPQQAAQPYLSMLIEDGGDQLASDIAREFFPIIAARWSAL